MLTIIDVKNFKIANSRNNIKQKNKPEADFICVKSSTSSLRKTSSNDLGGKIDSKISDVICVLNLSVSQCLCVSIGGGFKYSGEDGKRLGLS